MRGQLGGHPFYGANRQWEKKGKLLKSGRILWGRLKQSSAHRRIGFCSGKGKVRGKTKNCGASGRNQSDFLGWGVDEGRSSLEETNRT